MIRRRIFLLLPDGYRLTVDRGGLGIANKSIVSSKFALEWNGMGKLKLSSNVPISVTCEIPAAFTDLSASFQF